MTTTTYSTTDLQGVTLSGGNLTATSANIVVTNYVVGDQHDGKRSGKLYCEWLTGATFAGSSSCVGIVRGDATRTQIAPNADRSLLLYRSGSILFNGTSTGILLGTLTTNAFVHGAFDFDNNRAWFRKSGGNWNNNASFDPATNVGGIDISALDDKDIFAWFLGAGVANSGDSHTLNAGGSAFNGTPPSGFGTWDVNAVPFPTNGVFTQSGAEAWINNPSQAAFTQIGVDAWFDVAASAAFSQIGVEVWRSVTDFSPGGGAALLAGL